MLVIKKIKPMFNHLVTTMDKYEDDMTQNGVIFDRSKSKGAIKEYQKVIAVGSAVRDIKVGDMVCINPTRYAQVKHNKGGLKDGVITDNVVVGYNFNVVDIEDKSYLLLYDQDIRYVVEDYEEKPDPVPSSLIHPNKDIIIP